MVCTEHQHFEYKATTILDFERTSVTNHELLETKVCWWQTDQWRTLT